ncbi:MAG: hypothetical protein SFY81_03510 [Verrucomicrobiota bacterium]|nr:hypothetical protein [Verrucomicrobiota bacterium]
MKGKKSILLLDDHYPTIHLIRSVIDEYQGAFILYSSEHATDIRQFLLQGTPGTGEVSGVIPHLVLCAQHKLDEEGITLLRGLKTTQLKRLPIVIFAYSIIQEEVNLAYDLGANSVILLQKHTDELNGRLLTLLRFWCEIAVTPTDLRESNFSGMLPN